MSASQQVITGPGRLERVGSEVTPECRAYVLRLQDALVSVLASHNSRDVFLIALVGTVLGILAKAKVSDGLESDLDGNKTVLSEKQEVALLLCEAVYLFVHTCSETPSNDPVARLIWNKNRGEDLAKRVIDDGLSYIVHPHAFEILHFKSAPQYFHSKLKEALQRANVEENFLQPPEDFEAAARKFLVS
ncbi:hypothetical protein L218DRAFT_950498 [Marasmius fiardii PR-910]|nr:hypothetical protein L218DRAFT_950498 [Marasmius fiardii PR-910]